MVKRKRIALQYKINYDEATSIPIYLQNLIRAFNLLEDFQKPLIILVYQEDSPINDVKKIGYPYINFIKEYKDRAFVQKIFHKIWRLFSKKKVWVRKYWHPFYPKVDLSFPHLYFDNKNYLTKTIAWVVDFQQLFYPQFFTEKELVQFKDGIDLCIKSNMELMFSSIDSHTTFQKNYPNANNDFTILSFASLLSFSRQNIIELKNTFGIKNAYFITPNQFWPHKNHITILKAAKKLLEKRDDFEIVFTGKTSSYRNTNLFNELKTYVSENQLQDVVKFLGFVSRKDLLNLIENSNAIIQPSLFEGWSTLVEEAKALNKLILLSNLTIHREQISNNCLFFEELDYSLLANQMEKVLCGSIEIELKNYKDNIDKFKKDICKTFKLN